MLNYQRVSVYLYGTISQSNMWYFSIALFYCQSTQYTFFTGGMVIDIADLKSCGMMWSFYPKPLR